MFWRRALIVPAAAVLLALPSSGQQQSSTDAQAPDSEQQQASPASDSTQEKPPTGIKKVLRRAAPNCAHIGGREDCWAKSEQQEESEQKQKQESGQQKQPRVPENQPAPRSDGGVSSSRSTKIELAPRSGSVSGSGAAPDVQELHPYDPHRAEKDVEVGDFYFKRQNYGAAESRYAEALRWKPNDAIATFRLAEAQEKLGKISEARKNYQGYLKILPHGEFAEQAQKALTRLNLKMQSQESPLTSPPGETHPY